MARRMGFSVIGLPHYTIWHLYEPSVDDLQHMEEMEQERLEREREEQEQAERAERVQTLFKDAKSQWEDDTANIQEAIDKEGKSQASDYSSSSDVDSTKGSAEGPVAQPAAKEQGSAAITQEESTKERKQAKQ